jgi:class 3 adenylate cyclase/tetratricopeptide (TPR) repeat protein/TolB-like protein
MRKDSRKIAAILAADVVGYSRLMGIDEPGTLEALKIRRALFDRTVADFDGQEFGSVGDSLMAQFPSAINAVLAAQSIQQQIAAANAPLAADRRMSLRIGVNLGDVIEEDGALFGDGVNIAARLQALAQPGGILISGAVYGQVKNKVNASFTFVGARQVKNIAEAVRTFEVSEPVAPTFLLRVSAPFRRPVVVAAVAYAMLAWVLYWACTRLTASAQVPPWALPTLTTLLAAGFVPVMAATWHFDRRHHAAPWIGVMATVVSILVCSTLTWVGWRSYFDARAKAAITRPAVAAQPVVAVAAFQNLTGDPKLDWMKEGVANLVRDGLAESSHLVVVSPRRWQAVLRKEGSVAEASAAALASAANAGIGYVISGEFLTAPEGLLLTTRLTDVGSGVEMGGHRGEKLSPPALLGESARIVLDAKRRLGVPHTEAVASFSADFAVNNMAAYEAYLAGIGFFLKFDYRAAEQAFRSAIQLAPDFHMARYRLAQCEVAGGDTEGGLATIGQIPADAPLTRRERYYVDGARAMFARDTDTAKAVYTKMLEEFPYDVEAHWLLALSHDLAFEDEAAVTGLRRLLAQEPENDYLWSYLAETYLRLGQYDRARDALDHYLAFKPDDPFGFTILGQYALQTGDLEGATRHFEHAQQIEPGFTAAKLALARTQWLRDQWEQAETLLRAVSADESAAPAIRIDAAFDLSALLRAQGRFAGSLEPLERLEPLIRREHVRESGALSQRGLSQAEMGRFTEGARLIELAIKRFPGVPTRHLFARGLMALMQSDAAAVRGVAARIRAQEFPPNDPDGTNLAREDAVRAATYLDGMMDLASGDASKAVNTLQRAVSLPGYRYAMYELGLARAVFAQGDREKALTLAHAAATERGEDLLLDEMRFDLELDRARAMLLEAEILAALDRQAEARRRAGEFLKRWKNSDARQADRVRAEGLARTANP